MGRRDEARGGHSGDTLFNCSEKSRGEGVTGSGSAERGPRLPCSTQVASVAPHCLLGTIQAGGGGRRGHGLASLHFPPTTRSPTSSPPRPFTLTVSPPQVLSCNRLSRLSSVRCVSCWVPPVPHWGCTVQADCSVLTGHPVYGAWEVSSWGPEH